MHQIIQYFNVIMVHIVINYTAHFVYSPLNSCMCIYIGYWTLNIYYCIRGEIIGFSIKHAHLAGLPGPDLVTVPDC